MTNQEILQIAIQQSAYDINADASDFLPELAVKNKWRPESFLRHHVCKKNKRRFLFRENRTTRFVSAVFLISGSSV